MGANSSARPGRHGDVVLESAAESLAQGSGWAAKGQHVYDLAHPARGRSELAEERSEEHTSELQSHVNLVCRLLLEKKKNNDEPERVILKQHDIWDYFGSPILNSAPNRCREHSL